MEHDRFGKTGDNRKQVSLYERRVFEPDYSDAATMAGKDKKKRGESWQSEDMCRALSALKNGDMGLRSAARCYGVPVTTLKRRYDGRNIYAVAASRHTGRPPVLPPVLEEELAELLLEAEHLCFGFTRDMVMSLAYEIAEKNGIDHVFNKNKKRAGKDWLTLFLKRNPRLSLRQPEATSWARAQGFNRQSVKSFFDMLEEILDQNNITAAGIYNMDETGISTVQKKCRKVLAKKGKHQVGSMTSGERGTNTTIVCCTSAAGHFVPPLILFKRKRIPAELRDGAPPGSIVTGNESGWMDKDLFLLWLRHFIDIVKPSRENKVLLILDGHTAHIRSIQAIDLAREAGVIMLSLPPHTTHKLQPLDVTFFRPLQTFYAQAQEMWLRNNPGRPITTFQVSELFGIAYTKAATMSNAVSGFAKCGIWPCNRDIFTDFYFAPTHAYLSTNSGSTQSSSQSRPPPPPSADEPIPSPSGDGVRTPQSTDSPVPFPAVESTVPFPAAEGPVPLPASESLLPIPAADRPVTPPALNPHSSSLAEKLGSSRPPPVPPRLGPPEMVSQSYPPNMPALPPLCLPSLKTTQSAYGLSSSQPSEARLTRNTAPPLPTCCPRAIEQSQTVNNQAEQSNNALPPRHPHTTRGPPSSSRQSVPAQPTRNEQSRASFLRDELSVVKTNPDGRCFFRSVVIAQNPNMQKAARDMNGTLFDPLLKLMETSQSDLLRAQTVLYMTENSADFAHLESACNFDMPSRPTINFASISERIRSMANPTCCVGELEISCVSEVLNMPIHILHAHEGHVIKYKENKFSDASPIRLLFTSHGDNAGHYDCLIPRYMSVHEISPLPSLGENGQAKRSKRKAEAQILASSHYKAKVAASMAGKQTQKKNKTPVVSLHLSSRACKRNERKTVLTNADDLAEGSWYCFVCGDCSVEDMIQCNTCKQWVHEDCAETR